MAQIIKSSGVVIEVTPKNGTDFSLEELQEIVGGYIGILHLKDKRIIVYDEEGELKNSPLNQKATELLNRNSYCVEGTIVGDVLVCDSEQVK